MNELQERALREIIGRTNSPVDRQTQLAAIAYAKGKGIEAECLELIRELRANWMAYQFALQRRWQLQTKNPNKANHHDSISIREKYVRC